MPDFYKQALIYLFHLDEARGIKRGSSYSSLSLIQSSNHSFQVWWLPPLKKTVTSSKKSQYAVNYLRTLPTASLGFLRGFRQPERDDIVPLAEIWVTGERRTKYLFLSQTALQAYLTARLITSSSNLKDSRQKPTQLAAHVNGLDGSLVCTAGPLEDATTPARSKQSNAGADPKLHSSSSGCIKSLLKWMLYKPRTRALLEPVLSCKFYLNCDVSLCLDTDP